MRSGQQPYYDGPYARDPRRFDPRFDPRMDPWHSRYQVSQLLAPLGMDRLPVLQYGLVMLVAFQA